MTTSNEKLIVHKMTDLRQYLNQLEPYVAIGVEKYVQDQEKRLIVERLIELIVEFASDINRIVIEAEAKAPVESYYNSFTRLGELEVISQELSRRLASTTGLRNRLVHDYEKVEHRIVYHSAVRLLKDYRRYYQLIEKYLQSKE